MFAHILRHSPLIAPLLTVAACGTQADFTYRGVALATLRGTVVTQSKTAIPLLDAALLWDNVTPNTADRKATIPRKEVGTSAPVSGQFPANFTLQVFTPPPDDALFSCFPGDASHAGRMGVATVAAIGQGSNPASITATDIYGTVSELLVAYTDTDLSATSQCPGGALSRGYHLLAVTQATLTTPDPKCAITPPDDPACQTKAVYKEVLLTTPLTLVAHSTSVATPPPTPIPPAVP